jgi:hypothetical protein
VPARKPLRLRPDFRPGFVGGPDPSVRRQQSLVWGQAIGFFSSDECPPRGQGKIAEVADDHLVLPAPPKPEQTDLRPHRVNVRLSVIAMCIAILAAAATVYQGCEGAKSRLASERSAAAAEQSAQAASALNELTSQGLVAAQAAAAAAERAASATDRQAQLVVEQVKLAQLGIEEARGANRLTVESLRARLTAAAVARGPVKTGAPFAGEVLVSNTGASEAVNVSVRAAMQFATGLPSGTMPSLPPAPGGMRAVLSPKARLVIEMRIPADAMTDSVVSEIAQGIMRLYIFGSVAYDTFGAGHETQFCYQPSLSSPEKASPCPVWNESR